MTTKSDNGGFFKNPQIALCHKLTKWNVNGRLVIGFVPYLKFMKGMTVLYVREYFFLRNIQ